jgi:hypothetical protein
MRRLGLVLALVAGCACSNKEATTVTPTTETPPPPPPPPVVDAAPAAVGKPVMPEVANAGPGYLFVKGKDYEGVISSGGGEWTPSPMDVAELEVVLGPAIAAHPKLGPAHPAADFRREYAGTKVDGKDVIRIRLACQVDADWPSQGLPGVKDGGACYGYGTFDMATKTITSLEANGEG